MSSQGPADERSNRSLGPNTPDQASPDEIFLARAEALRLQQEWKRNLDMRKYVSESCKRYRYRGRPIWLDPKSRQLFRESLKRDNGVFTVATCEAMIAAVESSADQRVRDEALDEGADSIRVKLAAKQASDDNVVPQPPEVLKLGYFEHRRKDRVKYVTRVFLISDGPISPGRTKDVSETGMQVQLSFLGDYQAGDVVQVKFPNLPDFKDAQASYRVIRIIRKTNECFVSLRCEEESSHPVPAFVRSLVNRPGDGGGGQQDLDAEDAFLTAASLLAESHYMRSTSLIPFFLAHGEPNDFELSVVCCNVVNGGSLFVFETETGGNRFGKMLHLRYLRHFMKLAKVDGQICAMLAVWQTSGTGDLETLMDLDCKTDADWYGCLAKHRNKDKFRAFKVIVRKARKPHEHRLARQLEPLAAKSPDQAKRLLRNVGHIIGVGLLMDMTAEIRAWNLTPYESAPLGEVLRYTEDREHPEAGTPNLLPIEDDESMRLYSVQAAEIRLYSSFFIESTPTLPVLYFLSETGASLSPRVCMPRKSSPLSAFLEIADGKYDFSTITAPVLTSHLWTEMGRHGRGETNLYLVKERIPNRPEFEISAVADFQFANRFERGQFLDATFGQDLRVLKITMSSPRPLSSPELALVLKRVERYSPQRASRLRVEFEQLVAVGDLVDVTTTLDEHRYIAP